MLKLSLSEKQNEFGNTNCYALLLIEQLLLIDNCEAIMHLELLKTDDNFISVISIGESEV